MKHGFRLVIFSVLSAGCYSLQPALGPAPKNGDQVAFEITDQGRVFLGGAMGPEIGQVEGRLLESENGEYVLGVTSVRTIRGGVQVWSGERVRIEKQYVSRMYEKKFSKGRTFVMGVVAVGGAVFLFGRSLGVFGGGDTPVTPPIDTFPSLVARP
jgi:hypothetical protein